MPLINCPDCGKEVSDNAPTCPNCGNSINKKLYGPGVGQNYKKKKSPFTIILIVLGIIMLIGILANLGESESEDPESKTVSNNSNNAKAATTVAELEIIDVDYMVLYQDYQDNPIAADKKYKGKILRVTGIVDNIDREILGHTYITFDVGELFGNIRLTFRKSEEDKVAELKKGQEVTVVGECDGTLLSSTVALDDCYLE